MTTASALKQFVSLVRDEDLPFKAAGIAFYAIPSFVPLVILAIAVLSYVGAAGQVVTAVESSLTTSGAETLEWVLANTRGRSVASGVGLLVTVWSGTRIVRGLSVAFAQLYQREAALPLVAEVLRSLVVLAVLVVVVVALGAVSAPLTCRWPFRIRLSSGTGWRWSSSLGYCCRCSTFSRRIRSRLGRRFRGRC
ncbi:YhjD/YihY/BrkB family envelope integrity protein [Halobacteriales archaeon Cl-PHB]